MLAKFLLRHWLHLHVSFEVRETVNILWYLLRCCLWESSISFKGCSVLPCPRNTLMYKLLANQKVLLVLCISLKSLYRFWTWQEFVIAVTNPFFANQYLLCYFQFFLHAVLCLCALNTPLELHDSYWKMFCSSEEIGIIEPLLWGSNGRWCIIIFNYYKK